MSCQGKNLVFFIADAAATPLSALGRYLRSLFVEILTTCVILFFRCPLRWRGGGARVDRDVDSKRSPRWRRSRPFQPKSSAPAPHHIPRLSVSMSRCSSPSLSFCVPVSLCPCLSVSLSLCLPPSLSSCLPSPASPHLSPLETPQAGWGWGLWWIMRLTARKDIS